jgi:hypothetical protein
MKGKNGRILPKSERNLALSGDKLIVKAVEEESL